LSRITREAIDHCTQAMAAVEGRIAGLEAGEMPPGSADNDFQVSLEEYEAARHEIVLRSATRRGRYPLLWLPLGEWRRDPIITEPWSADREIEALRKEVVMNWERRGLALRLDALTPWELGIMDRLQGILVLLLGKLGACAIPHHQSRSDSHRKGLVVSPPGPIAQISNDMAGRW